MSLKSVDLQFAVHRNPDAGQAQNQMQHKPLQDQNQLAGQQAKQVDLRRQQSEKMEKASQNGVGHSAKDGKGRKRNEGKSIPRKENAGEKASAAPEHPYKGRHIDLML